MTNVAAYDEAQIMPKPAYENISQRLLVADAMWRDAMAVRAKYIPGRDIMAGAALFVLLQSFINELTEDVSLRSRLKQDLENKLRADFPAHIGRLF